MVDGTILHKLNLTFAHHIPNLILDFFFAIFNQMAKDPTMMFLSLIWIIPPRKWWLHGISWSQGNKSEI
jgi:hypothetical protein